MSCDDVIKASSQLAGPLHVFHTVSCASQADPAAAAEALAGPRLLDAVRAHYGTRGAAPLPEADRPAAGGDLAPTDLRALRQVGPLEPPSKTQVVTESELQQPGARGPARAAAGEPLA